MSEPPAEESTREQSVVESTVLPDSTVGLRRHDAPDGSDLDRPTFSYCEQAEAVSTGDDLRVARTQRWWSDDAVREGSPGGVNVSSEVVYCSGDGAQQLMGALTGVPDACPGDVQLDDGTCRYAASPQPSEVPDGAVVLHMDLTTDYSPPMQGFVVAQAAGDVVSIVYASSDDEALLDQLATRLAADAQDLLAAAVPSH